MRRLALLALATLAAVGAVAAPLLASGGKATPESSEATWEVSVKNLTPPGSQPLSPPLAVVHSRHADVWSVGDVASHVVAAIAEDANNAPAEGALAQLPGVLSVTTVPGGPIPPGATRTFTVETTDKFSRLSLVTMLVNTNDAFTGLDALRLHGKGAVLETMAYDAGSEVNNEKTAFIPGPCCNNPFVRDPEGGLIAPHPGIKGVGDLDPAVYGWPEPAARITIERA